MVESRRYQLDILYGEALVARQGLNMACSDPTRLEIQKDNVLLNISSCVFSLPLWHLPN